MDEIIMDEKPFEMSLSVCRILRKKIQSEIDELKKFPGGSRERSLAMTKLEEGKMWLGKEMGNLGEELTEKEQ